MAHPNSEPKRTKVRPQILFLMTTFLNEVNIPRLPVPLLASTTSQILSALRPLVSAEEYDEMVAEANEFKHHRIINLIQQHLEAVASNPDFTCYLNSINDETNPGIYGELRGDILPRNPYLILEQDPYSKTLNPPSQAQRAANLINSSLKFVVSLRNETLKPDVTPKNGNPLTMNCYRNLFGTTRAPDTLDKPHHIILKKYKHINDSRHIVVICNNQYYKLEVLTKYTEEAYQEAKTKHRIWFSDHDLSLILQKIIDESNQFDTLDTVNNSIGSLTTQTYHVWKQGRMELEKSNAKMIDTVDNALFVVVLDVLNSPENDQDKTKVISYGTSELKPGTSIQCGSCTSRWYDKLQMIVTKNSVAGVVWESASMDSTAILRFISDIYTDSILKLARNINGTEYTLFDNNVEFVSAREDANKPGPVRLVLNRTPELQNLIHLSETRLADLIHQHDYRTLDLKLDTDYIAKSGFSVDSFLQVSLQIANYTLYGRIANTLEPITTRKFRDARTELIPVQDEEISRLVKLFISNSKSQDKLRAFKTAVTSHNERYRNAMIGKGFERHLWALVHVIKRPRAVDYLNEVNKDVVGLDPIPELALIPHLHIPFLSNASIEKISSPELLVSNCGNAAMRFFGIPPAHDQGFGIGYIIHPDKVCITASSKYRQTDRLLDTFKQVVTEIKRSIRQDSNFMLLVADSRPRRTELQKLRINKELLENVSSPLKRHPINLTWDYTPGSSTSKVSEYFVTNTDTVPPLEASDSEGRSSRSDSLEGHDFDVLGGYGYFDFGDIDVRSHELSRTQSNFNSSSNLTSRHHSSSNLSALAGHTSKDLEHKLSLSEKIRDKLLSDDEEPPQEKRRPKKEIGRDIVPQK